MWNLGNLDRLSFDKFQSQLQLVTTCPWSQKVSDVGDRNSEFEAPAFPGSSGKRKDTSPLAVLEA